MDINYTKGILLTLLCLTLGGCGDQESSSDSDSDYIPVIRTRESSDQVSQATAEVDEQSVISTNTHLNSEQNNDQSCIERMTPIMGQDRVVHGEMANPEPTVCGNELCETNENCLSCEQNCGSCPSTDQDILINEVFINGSDDHIDWFELANQGDQDIDIRGWTMEDSEQNSIMFPPNTIVPAYGYIQLKRGEHFIFDLDNEDRLTLKNTNGTVIDSTSWENDDCPIDSSWARTPDLTGPFQVSQQPTPDKENHVMDNYARCGDLICNSHETCTSCAVDCGHCVDCPTELFISEYVEGSSNNKALELFNGTGVDIDLSSYQIWGITNGGVWGESMTDLQGILFNAETLVLCNRDIDPEYAGLCDEFYSTHPVNFNGDDAIGLAKEEDGVFQLIDQLGQDGDDVGEGWTVADVSYATKNHTLIRNPQASSSTDWFNSAESDWLVYDQDYFGSLGFHNYANQSCIQ